MTRRQLASELATLPKSARVLARNRLAVLQAFWRADKAAAGRNRCRTMQRVADEWTREHPGFPIARRAIERWRQGFEREGVEALGRVPGRRSKPVSTVAELAAMPAPAMLQAIAELLNNLAARQEEVR